MDLLRENIMKDTQRLDFAISLVRKEAEKRYHYSQSRFDYQFKLLIDSMPKIGKLLQSRNDWMYK